jgi:hypothetical protein
MVAPVEQVHWELVELVKLSAAAAVQVPQAAAARAVK